MKPWGIPAVLLALVLAPATGRATTIGICDSDDPGKCTVAIDFNAITDTLTITLTNTSHVATGGFLTAFAFDLGVGEVADIGVLAFAGDPAYPAFTLNPGAPSTGTSINVAPAGDREFVITATSGDYLGGGSPNGGIAPGSNASFTLILTGD